MNRREATAAAKRRLQFGYFDSRGTGGDVYVTCSAPCHEKVSVDRFTRRSDLPTALLNSLTDHIADTH